MTPLATPNLIPSALLLQRTALGAVFIAHGGQKLFGLWDGAGLSATVQSFEQFMGIPPWLTVAAALTEFFGGAAVLTGLFTRVACAGLAVVMLVAIFQAHWPNGFFINWDMVRGQGHGIEFDVTLLAVAAGLVLSGPGKYSMDRLLGIEVR